MSLASFLPPYRTEYHVLRAVVLSIVATVGVGQNVGLLCRTWCDALAATASECHHENSSTTSIVAGDEDCGKVVVAATAVLREDVRRDVPSQDTNQAIPIPPYALAQLKVDARPGQEPWRDGSLEKRLLSAALRI